MWGQLKAVCWFVLLWVFWPVARAFWEICTGWRREVIFFTLLFVFLVTEFRRCLRVFD